MKKSRIVLDENEEEIADNIARRAPWKTSWKKKESAKNFSSAHEEYVKEIRMQVIKENTGAENAQTLKKLALLEKLEQRKLSASLWIFYGPARFEEIIGQERAVKALWQKLGSPYRST
jgi:ATP-dependent Lon protease